MIRVVAVVGSYHRGGIVDSAVDAVLEGARSAGAQTNKISLLDKHIEFCNNCRKCAQVGGIARGKCDQPDDLESVLSEVESADAIVLGSPVNYFNVTALFRRFMERLLGYTYWPWGSKLGPLLRSERHTRRAVLVTSASMPSVLIPFVTGATRALRITAHLLGARPVGKLWIGMVPATPQPKLTPATRNRALRLGARLVRT